MTIKPYTAPIEPGIAPVCEALNEIDGITTVWSCEGHPERPTAPYVMFIASEENARLIDRMLRKERLNGALNYNWWVRGSFSDKGIWRYSIETNDVRFRKRLRFGFLPAWNKHRVNIELSVIAKQLRNVFGKP